MMPALLLLLLAGGPAAAAAAAEPIAVPDGVASADSSVAYVRNRARGIDALDLETGRVRWSVPGPALPVMALGADLVSLERNRLAIHEAAGGRARLESKPLGIPDSVPIVSVHEQRSSQVFNVRTRLEGVRLLLEWTSTTTHVYGMRPPDSSEQTGAVEVNLSSGSASPLPAGSLPAPKPPPVPEPLQRAEGYTNLNPPIISRDQVSALRVEERGGHKVLVLRRWSGGQELPEAVLPSELRGTGLVVLQPSLDRQHVAVTWQYPTQEQTPKKIPHDLYSLVTAKKVGSLESPVRLAELAVVGTRVLFRSGDRLVAMDLSGRSLWEHPLWTIPQFPPVP